MHQKYVSLILCIMAISFLSIISYAEDMFQVTYETEGITDFVWSPDGEKFAYTALDNGLSKLFLINTDGTNKIELCDSAFNDIDWKNNIIVFYGLDPNATGPYNSLLKRSTLMEQENQKLSGLIGIKVFTCRKTVRQFCTGVPQMDGGAPCIVI